jgi:hypothetical protein
VQSRQSLDPLTALVDLILLVGKRMRCLLRPLGITLNKEKVTVVHHPFIAAALAEPCQADLRRQADR